MSRGNGRKKRTGRPARSTGSVGQYFDYSLLFIIIFLLCFGLVMLYSTSSYESQVKFGDSGYYLKKQLFSTSLGLVCMVAFIIFGYKRAYMWAKIFYLLSLLSVLAVMTPLGVSSNGAKRWINLGFSTVQPAEFVKLAVIIMMACYIHKHVASLGNVKGYVKALVIVAVPAGMIAVITSNLSSAIIVVMIGFVMLYVACPKKKYLFFTALMAAVLVGAFILLGTFFGEGFRANRVAVWMNPEKYSDEGGYQIMQGLYAIGSGGLFGKGLGQSVQKLGFVPEAQNDYIFTIICEELGLFGGLAVIFMFLFMIWRFMFISQNAPDLFSSLLVIGTMAHISVQVILNIAVVTNTIPNTGVTLPFISYGGTSIIFLLMEMGLVLSVSLGIKSR